MTMSVYEDPIPQGHFQPVPYEHGSDSLRWLFEMWLWGVCVDMFTGNQANQYHFIYRTVQSDVSLHH